MTRVRVRMPVITPVEAIGVRTPVPAASACATPAAALPGPSTAQA